MGLERPPGQSVAAAAVAIADAADAADVAHAVAAVAANSIAHFAAECKTLCVLSG